MKGALVIQQLQKRSRCVDFESVMLDQACGRVAAKDLTASANVPADDESERDGYAIYENYENDSATFTHFHNVGEVAAGDQANVLLQPQQVCKVMTGAVVPNGCYRVVPQEHCRVEGSRVTIPTQVLTDKNSFIKKKGRDLSMGQSIVSTGTILSMESILQSVSLGVDSFEVYKQPKVSFFCSGQELTAPGQTQLEGKKYSTNQFLLSSLIRRFGGKANSLGLVGDSLTELKNVFLNIDSHSSDMILSTGGTGPGKYDFLQQAFEEAGGEIFSTSLSMRPGKTFLSGQLNGVIYCGLPGPPAAVETLIYEIIGPVLVALQGVPSYEPSQIKAFLEEDIHTRSLNVVRLKGGNLTFKAGKCHVRLAGKREPANCNIVLEPKRSTYNKGEIVDVHPKSSPFDDFSFDNLGNNNLPVPQL